MTIRRPHEDSGSVLIGLTLAVLLFCCALVICWRVTANNAMQRAEAAADLSALAGAGRIGIAEDECATVATIAASNGTCMRTCTVVTAADGRSGTVSVSVSTQLTLPVIGTRTVVARARAERMATVGS